MTEEGGREGGRERAAQGGMERDRQSPNLVHSHTHTHMHTVKEKALRQAATLHGAKLNQMYDPYA